MADEATNRFERVLARLQHDAAFRERLLREPLAALAPYPLTEEQRQRLILPNFGWLIEGRLAGVARPGSRDAVALLVTLGIGALVSLSEEPLAPTLTAGFNLARVHLPVADFTAPSLAQLEQAVAAINRFLAEGRPVAVHCGAGLGRTGTVLAAYLVQQGYAAAAAIGLVRARRPGSIETPAQAAVVAEYARALARRG